jgi:hypothetical protein
MMSEISGSHGAEYEDDYFAAPCSMVEDYRRLKGACCRRHQGNRQKTVIFTFDDR